MKTFTMLCLAGFLMASFMGAQSALPTVPAQSVAIVVIPVMQADGGMASGQQIRWTLISAPASSVAMHIDFKSAAGGGSTPTPQLVRGYDYTHKASFTGTGFTVNPGENLDLAVTGECYDTDCLGSELGWYGLTPAQRPEVWVLGLLTGPDPVAVAVAAQSVKVSPFTSVSPVPSSLPVWLANQLAAAWYGEAAQSAGSDHFVFSNFNSFSISATMRFLEKNGMALGVISIPEIPANGMLDKDDVIVPAGTHLVVVEFTANQGIGGPAIRAAFTHQLVTGTDPSQIRVTVPSFPFLQ